MSRRDDEVTFSMRLTGYCGEDTKFLITKKHQGTDPDFKVYQSNKRFNGSLTLSKEAALKLARTLLYLAGEDN